MFGSWFTIDPSKLIIDVFVRKCCCVDASSELRGKNRRDVHCGEQLRRTVVSSREEQWREGRWPLLFWCASVPTRAFSL
jgi:hypothetical protein